MHVAEVDDAGDPAVGGEQVGQGDVGVVDPAGQRGQRGSDRGHPLDDRAERVVGREPRACRDAREARVRPSRARGCRRPGGRSRAARGAVRAVAAPTCSARSSVTTCPSSGVPGTVVISRARHARPVVVDDRDDVGAVERGARPRDRAGPGRSAATCRIAATSMSTSARVLGRVGDLEDVAGADEEVEVALARQRRDLAGHPPVGLGEPAYAVGREAGVRARPARRASPAKSRGSVREHAGVSRPTPHVRSTATSSRQHRRDAAGGRPPRGSRCVRTPRPTSRSRSRAPARGRGGRPDRGDGRRGRGLRRGLRRPVHRLPALGRRRAGRPAARRAGRASACAVGVDSVESVAALAPWPTPGCGSASRSTAATTAAACLPSDVGEVARAAAEAGLAVDGVFTFPGHSYSPDAARSAAADEAARARRRPATRLVARRDSRAPS